MSEDIDNQQEESPEESEQLSFPQNINDIDDVLSHTINLSESHILHEPTCIICNHPNRKEIEEKWHETKSHTEVKSFFKTISDIKLSDGIIDNHIENHCRRLKNELQKIEYINKIRRMSSVELTTLDRIKLALAALDERLVGINSIVPTRDISAAEVEKIKSSEVAKISTSYGTLLKLKSAIMGELYNQGDLIIIPKTIFVEAFNSALSSAKSEEQKEIILNLLTVLSELNKRSQ